MIRANDEKAGTLAEPAEQKIAVVTATMKSSSEVPELTRLLKLRQDDWLTLSSEL